MEQNLFKVEAKCGHVGKHYYIPIAYPVVASSSSEAAKIVRNFPRVKHDHKDAILSVTRISKEEYDELVIINNNDPYLQCKSIQDQKYYCDLDNRLVHEDFEELDEKELKAARKERVNYKLKQIKYYLDSYDCYECAV